MNSGFLRAVGLGVLALGLLTAAAPGQTPRMRGFLSPRQDPPPPVTPAAKEKSQNNFSSPGEAQDAPKDESAGTTSKKVKTKKGKVEPGKVYSEDDLQRLPDGGVSVIGQKPAPVDDGPKTKGTDAKADASKGDAGKGEKADKPEVPEVKDEFYWRKRAQKILEPLEALNAEIQRVQDESKRPRPSKPDSDNDDRNGAAGTSDPRSLLRDLEKQKADLEKQLDDLQDEGRRAGAPSEWFR